MQGLRLAIKRHLFKMRLLCGDEGGSYNQSLSLGRKILVMYYSANFIIAKSS